MRRIAVRLVVVLVMGCANQAPFAVGALAATTPPVATSISVPATGAHGSLLVSGMPSPASASTMAARR